MAREQHPPSWYLRRDQFWTPPFARGAGVSLRGPRQRGTPANAITIDRLLTSMAQISLALASFLPFMAYWSLNRAINSSSINSSSSKPAGYPSSASAQAPFKPPPSLPQPPLISTRSDVGQQGSEGQRIPERRAVMDAKKTQRSTLWKSDISLKSATASWSAVASANAYYMPGTLVVGPR